MAAKRRTLDSLLNTYGALQRKAAIHQFRIDDNFAHQSQVDYHKDKLAAVRKRLRKVRALFHTNFIHMGPPYAE